MQMHECFFSSLEILKCLGVERSNFFGGYFQMMGDMG